MEREREREGAPRVIAEMIADVMSHSQIHCVAVIEELSLFRTPVLSLLLLEKREQETEKAQNPRSLGLAWLSP